MAEIESAAGSLEQSFVRLRDALERAASGDLHVSLDPGCVAPPVAPLARALNHLLERRRDAEDAWRRREAKYRGLVEDGHSVVRESEELFHTLATVSPVGIFRTDGQGRCTYVNEYWCTVAGLSLAEALGEGWVRGLHPDDRERVVAEWDRSIRGRLIFRAEYRLQRPDGRITWVLGHARAESTAAGELRGFVGSITDITERKRAEQALLEAERAKRDTARSAADAERRRLAHELHDGVLQDLSAIKLILEAERRRGRGETLDTALERIAGVIREVRDVVDNLQPGDLSLASLQEAIAAHARWLTRPGGMALTLDFDPNVCIASAGVRDLYRIAQEALANAVRHGYPTRIAVRLRRRASDTLLEIEDDGTGFDVTARHRGMGLLSMRERAAALGGDLDITSAAGQGTSVRVVIRSGDANAVASPSPATAASGR